MRSVLAIFVVLFVTSNHLLGGDKALLQADTFTKARISVMGWTPFAQRPQILPECAVDPAVARKGEGSLAIRTQKNPFASGGWTIAVKGIREGQRYRFSAWHREENIPHPSYKVVARIDWKDAAGKRISKPDYLPDETQDGEWTESVDELVVPAGAVAAQLELSIYNAPNGTVWWDDINVVPMNPPAPRIIRVGTVHLRPRGNTDPLDNVRKFIALIDEMAAQRPDIICLPEGITKHGISRSYVEVSEPLPGPTTRLLGEAAKRNNCYIVAGVYERVGDIAYNTSVLIDRKGELAGSYRKVYLPREEIEAGLTPGNTFPVFTTDFGKIGMMICWDVQYPDPANRLAQQGADLILLPIWGGNKHLVYARAIENATFLVSSCYSQSSFIIDPDGNTLGEVAESDRWAVAEIDLNREYRDEWLGNMKTRARKEYRFDVP